jgi:hypothetical protein
MGFTKLSSYRQPMSVALTFDKYFNEQRKRLKTSQIKNQHEEPRRKKSRRDKDCNDVQLQIQDSTVPDKNKIQQHQESVVGLEADPIKYTFGGEKVVKFGGRVASLSKQPGLNDPASLLSHRHASSTSTGPSASQSRDARLPLVRSRQFVLPSDENSITGHSNSPGIPVVPAFEVENFFLFVAR